MVEDWRGEHLVRGLRFSEDNHKIAAAKASAVARRRIAAPELQVCAHTGCDTKLSMNTRGTLCRKHYLASVAK